MRACRADHVSSGLDCEREVLVFSCGARVPFVFAAGWVVVERADAIRALSCTTRSVKRICYCTIWLVRNAILLILLVSLVQQEVVLL